MNMMKSSIQVLLIEKHAGPACAYIKKLTNFQNKNYHNSKKKKQKQGNIITNNIIKNKAKNSLLEQHHQYTHCIIISQIAVVTYNPGQNIWNKIEKSSKTGQEKKSLISNFACFLTATAQV